MRIFDLLKIILLNINYYYSVVKVFFCGVGGVVLGLG